MTWLIRTLAKPSDQIGLAPSLLCALAWVAGSAAVARAAVAALSEYPALAEVFLVVVAILAGIDGLVCFWISADHVDFWRRGYQINWVTGNGSTRNAGPMAQSKLEATPPGECPLFLRALRPSRECRRAARIPVIDPAKCLRPRRDPPEPCQYSASLLSG